MKKIIKQEKGFTLVEVILSFTILSIIILTFSNIFLFTNNTANRNNEKLVAIHLARATLENIKNNPSNYFILTDQSITPAEGYQFESDGSIKLTQVINDQDYEIQIEPNRSDENTQLGLVHILVITKLVDAKTPISSKVEGYVNYEK